MRNFVILMGLAAALAGCAASPDPDSLSFDPLEEQNRQAHALNKEIDASVYGPVARSYGEAVPAQARQTITNLRNNWRLPGQVIQYGLQGRGTDAAKSTTRFAVNTLLGLGGLLDIATRHGPPLRRDQLRRGLLPLGRPRGRLSRAAGGRARAPSATGRATCSTSSSTRPGTCCRSRRRTRSSSLGGLDLVNDRYELDPVLDSLLYECADSYTAQRTSYLQNMRARLKGGTDIDTLEDIYADQ